MKPIDIAYQIKKAGFTQKDIADRVNKTSQAINQAIWHGRGSEEVKGAIAEVLGKTINEVWPK